MNKLPPQNIPTEESILSSCLLGYSDQAVNSIQPDDFYRSAHNKIFSAIVELCEKKEPVDLQTVYILLKKKGQTEEVGGASYLAQLTETTSMAVNIEAYCKEIKEKSVLRKIIERCNTVYNKCFDNTADVFKILEDAGNITSNITFATDEISSYRDLSLSAGDRYEAAYRSKGKITGLPSGFYDLDWVTCGFQNTDLVLIAARPSMGKTALMLNIAGHTAKQGFPVLIFSHEMSKEQLFDRQIASESMVNLQKFRSGRFDSNDWENINKAQSTVYEWPVYIEDLSALHHSVIRQKAYSMKRKHGIQMIMIDYLQLVRGDRESSRDREVANISGAFKAMAKDLKIPVIVLSQLNRSLENRGDKRPKLSDLRDSGTLEQDADLVMFLYRPSVYGEDEDFPGHTELCLAKHRNGPTTTIRLQWEEKYTSFKNLQREVKDE